MNKVEVEIEVEVEQELYVLAEKEGKKINLTAEEYMAKAIEEYVKKHGSVNRNCVSAQS